MRLSIVTINYNNAEGLRKTLSSVATQTYRDIEHIIIDAASTDGSVDVIREYESVNRSSIHPLTIIWSSEIDKGIYNGMNHGIQKASGDYVQILNSGDTLAASDVTERMIDALPKGVDILYGNMLKSFPDGKIVSDHGGDVYLPTSFMYFYYGTLNHDSAYIRRDLFDKYGLYNEDMKICSDWEWYVRALILGEASAVYTDIDVTIFDMTGVSENGGKNADLIKKERRGYLEKILPQAILHDYDRYHFPIDQYERLRKHHVWGFVWFIERVLYKLEKWKILK